MKRIMVFGMGGVGSYLGARLSVLDDAELVFIARGAHLKAIQSKGLSYQDPEGHETVVRPFLATDNPEEAGPVDYVFLCVKGYDLDSACKAVQPLLKSDTVILPLLNGADIYERIRSVIDGSVVLPGGIYISSSVCSPGHVIHGAGNGNVFMGREPGNASYDPAGLLDIFTRAGIPAEWHEDPFPAIWNKFLFIAAYGLVTGMSGKPIGAVIEDEDLASKVLGIQKEIAAIAKAKGISLADDAAEAAFEKGKSFPASMKTSFQRDLEVPGKPHEGDLFGGSILRMGRELGIATAVSSDVYNRILISKAGN